MTKPEAETRVPKHGRGRLRVGNPGNRGGGRPTDAFKAMCRELASSQAVETHIGEILQNPRHPNFIAALKWASENGYGKPTQAIRVAQDQLTPEERQQRVDAYLEIARARKAAEEAPAAPAKKKRGKRA